MSSMRVERAIDAPREAVWGIITDIERSAEVLSGVKAIERLDDGAGFGVGTRWNETRSVFGRDATQALEVTAVDEGASYTVESEAAGVHYRIVMAVADGGDGSRLSILFEGEPTSFVARVGAFVGKLFEGTTRKMLEQDLDDIAAAAQSSAS